jgi:hypothetical protein
VLYSAFANVKIVRKILGKDTHKKSAKIVDMCPRQSRLMERARYGLFVRCPITDTRQPKP